MKTKNRDRDKRKRRAVSLLPRKIVVNDRQYSYATDGGWLRIKDDTGKSRLYSFPDVFTFHSKAQKPVTWYDIERAHWKGSTNFNMTPKIVREVIEHADEVPSR